MRSGERRTLAQKFPQSFKNGLSESSIFIIELTGVIIGLKRIYIFTRCFVFGMRIAVNPCL